MIYYFKDFENLLDETINNICNLFDDSLKNKLLRKINYKESVIGYFLLLKILREEYQIKKLPPISYNQNGKPYFLDYPNIHFNISHTKGFVCVVVSKVRVGIDVEIIKSHSDKLIKYVCNDLEQESIKSKNKEEKFVKIWTMKESYLKCLGLGIGYNIKGCLENFNSKCFSFKTEKIENFIITICENNVNVY